MRSKIWCVVAVFVLSSVTVLAYGAEAPENVGRWSAPFWEGDLEGRSYDPPSIENSKAYPTAVSLVQLPDGRLLYWSGLEGSENADVYIGSAEGAAVSENSRARLLDLRGDQPAWTVPTLERGTTADAHDDGKYATKDMFCADQRLLYDGTVLIAGGSEWRLDFVRDPLSADVYGDDEARVFDPSQDTFRSVERMSEPRWYPTLVTLPDGRVMIASGVRRLIASFERPEPAFSQVRLTEIFDPATGAWEAAGEDPWSLPLYPRLHLLPDGTVFYGGAGQTWGQAGETADMATWAMQRVYDPATETWTMLERNRYGVRGGAASTLLRLQPPYDSASVLTMGGTLGTSPGTWVGTTLSDVVTWRAGQGITAQADTTSPLAGLAGDQTQLRQGRWFGTPVTLPTGEVLLLNGGDLDDLWEPGAAAARRAPELYDPVSNTWRQLAPSGRDRVYHNTAVLLPDGRVLVGGNAPHPAYYSRHDNSLTRSNNFKDSTFEIYEPPYLFRGPRPVINSMSFSSDGRAVTIDATSADEVVLTRLGAVTHGRDADSRAVVLAHSDNGDGTVTATLPSGTVVPPGPYYLFVNRVGEEGGVPSVARTVMVRPDASSGRVVFAAP